MSDGKTYVDRSELQPQTVMSNLGAHEVPRLKAVAVGE